MKPEEKDIQERQLVELKTKYLEMMIELTKRYEEQKTQIELCPPVIVSRDEDN